MATNTVILNNSGTSWYYWYYGSATNVFNNSWHQIARTYNGSTITFYVDGNIDQQTTASISMGGNAYNLYIGSNGGAELFNGLIDDVRIYNRALSAAEIAAIYNATK